LLKNTLIGELKIIITEKIISDIKWLNNEELQSVAQEIQRNTSQSALAK